MKTKTVLMLTLLSLVGCTDETLIDVNETGGYDPSKVICITTDAITRGQPANTESQMSTLGLFCAYTGQGNWVPTVAPAKMFNRQLTRNGTTGRWEYFGGNPEKWNAVKADDRYTFFAYAPYATGGYNSTGNPTGNGLTVNTAAPGIPTLSYIVPANCASQPDLMVAVPRKDIRPTPNLVNLSMQHALTAVGFKVSGNGEKITRIQVAGVKSSATLSIDGSAINWSNLLSDFTFDAKINTNITLTATPQSINTADGYLMMIPQTLGSNAKVILTLSDNTTKEVSLSTQVWAPGKRLDYTIALTLQGTILVSPNALTIPAKGGGWAENPISVSCQYPTQTWTLSTTASWLQLSLNSGGSGAGQSVSGTGSQPLYTSMTENTSNANRTATITLNGNVVVTITQVKKLNPSLYPTGGTAPTNTVSYVGAFWRASQKGERIIRIPVGTTAGNLGAWNASVAWMDAGWAANDIVLSTTTTTDPNVSFSANLTPGNAESYPVTGTATFVQGSVNSGENIYFRIGLKSTFVPTEAKPVRYAVILLQYGTPQKEQLIYLRQGEDPDYLMRTYEPGTSLVNRPLAKKYSPYNLTATTMTAGGTLVANHPQLNATTNKGTFTQFPSQAGAFFQWASPTFPLYAYHPNNPLGNITDWSITVHTTTWDSGTAPNRVVDLNESCPKSYSLSYGSSVNFRRANDGATNIVVPSPTMTVSETRQSLWLNIGPGVITSNTNVIYGYYADGYFDRRMLASTAEVTNGATNRAVSWNSKDVAYAGSLFINPVTNASLFFPASGIRYTPDKGGITAAGTTGYYWTSSTSDVNNGWAIFLLTTTTDAGFGFKNHGYNIRCVRE